MAKKHTTFHITLRPKNELKREVKIQELLKYIKGCCEEYIFAFETGKNSNEINHLHIGIILESERRQDKLRESILKFCDFDKDTLKCKACKVNIHWDWEYLVGYLHKEAIPKYISFKDEKFIEDCIKKYNTGVGEYKGEHKKNDMWSYDKIVISFSAWICELYPKDPGYTEGLWMEFLRKNIKKILPSTHAKIRKEPLMEWVSAYCQNFKKEKEQNN